MKLYLQYKCILAILLTYINISETVTTKQSKKTSQVVNITSTKPEITPSKIRIVTNHDIIRGGKGVPIEYWYNETSTDQGYKSSPGCPQSVDGYPWVHYGSPPRCFLVGFKGPCELRQSITPQSGSLYGICACECFVERVEYGLFLPNTSSRYIECIDTIIPGSPIIFDKREEKCIYIGTKGPCSSGKLVQKVSNGSLTCTQSCNGKDSNWRELERKGFCVQQKRFTATGVESILPGSCPSEKEYSSALKKCINPKFIRGGTLG